MNLNAKKEISNLQELKMKNNQLKILLIAKATKKIKKLMQGH